MKVSGLFHNSARNCSGVRSASLAMLPMVIALIGFWLGMIPSVYKHRYNILDME